MQISRKVYVLIRDQFHLVEYIIRLPLKFRRVIIFLVINAITVDYGLQRGQGALIRSRKMDKSILDYQPASCRLNWDGLTIPKY